MRIDCIASVLYGAPVGIVVEGGDVVSCREQGAAGQAPKAGKLTTAASSSARITAEVLALSRTM
jgi:hypothetical protein